MILASVQRAAYSHVRFASKSAAGAAINKVELIINLKSAKTFGLTIPEPPLGRADEVIE